MVKKKIWIAFVLLIMTCSFLQLIIREDTFSPRKKRITLIAPMGDVGYWTRIAEEMVKTGESYEMDVKCIGFRELNLRKQIEAIEGAIWSDVDGIITVGTEDTPEMRNVIMQAREVNIPIILIDSDIKDSRRNCYVGSDNYSAGELAGKNMLNICKGKGKILVVVSSMENENQIQRVEGFQNILAENSEMEVVGILEGESNEIYLQDKLVRFLEDDSDINGVFCAEGYSTECMCRLKDNVQGYYSGIHIVGFEGDIGIQGYLKDGIIDVNIQQDTREIGIQAMKLLENAMKKNVDCEDNYTNVEFLYPKDYTEMINYGDGEAIWCIY